MRRQSCIRRVATALDRARRDGGFISFHYCIRAAKAQTALRVSLGTVANGSQVASFDSVFFPFAAMAPPSFCPFHFISPSFRSHQCFPAIRQFAYSALLQHSHILALLPRGALVYAWRSHPIRFLRSPPATLHYSADSRPFLSFSSDVLAHAFELPNPCSFIFIILLVPALPRLDLAPSPHFLNRCHPPPRMHSTLPSFLFQTPCSHSCTLRAYDTPLWCDRPLLPA